MKKNIESTTINKNDHNRKAPSWILYLGLSIFLIFISLQIIFSDHSTTDDKTDPIIGTLRSVPMILVIMYSTLIAPLVEELSFRGWQLKNKFFKYLSCILVSTYCIFTFGYILGIFTAILHTFLIFYQPNCQKRILGIFYTSLVFAFIHWSNYAAIEILLIASIFGIGLVMSYITWRYSIIWSMLFHSAYNGILIFIF